MNQNHGIAITSWLYTPFQHQQNTPPDCLLDQHHTLAVLHHPVANKQTAPVPLALDRPRQAQTMIHEAREIGMASQKRRPPSPQHSAAKTQQHPAGFSEPILHPNQAIALALVAAQHSAPSTVRHLEITAQHFSLSNPSNIMLPSPHKATVEDSFYGATTYKCSSSPSTPTIGLLTPRPHSS